jgi:predicted N-formylglutamate amidohydrolase
LKSAIWRCAFLVTCEHGEIRFPTDYRDFFADNKALLQSHRAYDPGALRMARGIALQLP